jgi:MFS family permease
MTDSMAEPPPPPAPPAPPGEVREVRVGPPAAAVAVASPPELEVEATAPDRDRVRFGPVVAGLLTALTTLLLLGLLGVALGLAGGDPEPARPAAGPPPEAGPLAVFWAVLSAFLAFLLGGYVAGRTAAVFDRRWGGLNGALVFMLGVPLTLWLAGQGLGFAAGTLGSFVGALNVDPGQVQGAAGQAQGAAAQVRPADVARAAEGARNAAWGTLLGAALALSASALGGWLGTRRELEVERPATTTTTVETRRAAV